MLLRLLLPLALELLLRLLTSNARLSSPSRCYRLLGRPVATTPSFAVEVEFYDCSLDEQP